MSSVTHIVPIAIGDPEKCKAGCDACLRLGCPAIQADSSRVAIDASLCVGAACTLCQQLCPHKAIGPLGKASP